VFLKKNLKSHPVVHVPLEEVLLIPGAFFFSSDQPALFFTAKKDKKIIGETLLNKEGA